MGQIAGPFLRSAVPSCLKIFPNNTARAGLTLQIWALRCGDDLGLFWRLLGPMILHLRGAGSAITSDPLSSAARAATLPRSAEFVIVEGNYLLLDQDGWRDLRKFWDSAIMLMPPRAEIEARLLQRWIDHGHTPGAASARRDANDLPNAELVLANALPADWVMAEAA